MQGQELHLALFAGIPFLGSRARAFWARTEALKWLASSPDSEVVLDFKDVVGVSHSFSDELLSPLSDAWHEKVPERIRIVNCASEVRDHLEWTADLHDLTLPRFATATPQAA